MVGSRRECVFVTIYNIQCIFNHINLITLKIAVIRMGIMSKFKLLFIWNGQHCNTKVVISNGVD